MPDRDLLAEGRNLLPAAGELLTSGQAFDLAEWAGLNLPALLDELEAMRARVNELAAERRNPEEDVLVENSWIHPDDLPKICGNFMRLSDEYASKWKDACIELEKARRERDEAREAIDVVQIAHESQLTRLAKSRAKAQRKIDRLTEALEAAQRPPLGYLLVEKGIAQEDGTRANLIVHRTLPTLEAARERQAEEADWNRTLGKAYVPVIAELREV